MNISVLCKVVDNFGDIGVVWRLCCQLSNLIKKQNSSYIINLIVDDLVSFNKICKDVCIEKPFQIVNDINVYSWHENDFCYEVFSENDGEKLSVIVEAFQCGRPDWMEKILFEDKLNRTVQIIMIDYLTAEQYADDFHCLQSLTRSSKVQKVNFMPGFTDKTGGLIIDSAWENLCEYKNNKTLLCFTYDRDWNALANACIKSGTIEKVLLAPGKGFETLKTAFNSDVIKTSDLQIEELNFMNQNEWDNMMKNCSVLFIRGEESMSRACLSGIPFVWHAYPQSDEYQLVKVRALLNRMSVHFNSDDFRLIEKLWVMINSPEDDICEVEFENAIFDFLSNYESLVYGFKEFALDLRKNGDLCSNLMTFIKNKCIIESNNRNLF